ncbi:DUF1045 domain-containing protein [Paracoccus aerodenitrificans]|uniref:DUF1045 domain-containing protein n=1 Tax=Paracoccus aerodenitrificans TaxID=3017781 RepID=UPI0022F08845|nr:DUF1045 domain-containing protein [Paracoccus aerodenitrificans]WBU63420.1 DUF1045 domain-containing protein [Paracoccus aerodenitrificans]
MSPYRRYAVYYTPSPGGFADFGASWLGWDPVSGQEVAQPDLPGLDLAEITETPRKYGFHATLKPPFRLADDATPEKLRDAVAMQAQELKPVSLPGLRLERIGPFLALTPQGDTSGLRDLADKLVRSLDPLRAALTEQEIAKRNPERLSERQRILLKQWGYPYVMEEFRFHITLSGALDDATASAVEKVLTPLPEAVPQPFTLDAISLMGGGADGRFRLIEAFPL